MKLFFSTVVAALSVGLVGSTALSADRLVPSQYPTIQAGINAAVTGDSVVVAPGSYAPGFNFNGKLVHVRSEAGALATVIDLTTTGGTAVYATSSEPSGTSLSGFGIRGCSTSAIHVSNGACLSLIACRLFDCSVVSPGRGAGILVSAGELTASDCLFQNLIARGTGVNSSASGGAIFATNDASLTLTNCTFASCRAEFIYTGGGANNWIQANGGAIGLSQSSLAVVDCSFDGCTCYAERTAYTTSSYLTTTSSGGAIDARNGATVAVTSCDFGAQVPCYSKAIGRRAVSGSPSGGVFVPPVGADYVITSALGGSVAIDDSYCEVLSTTFAQGSCSAQTFTNSDPGYPCSDQSTPRPLNDSQTIARGGHVHAGGQPSSVVRLIGSRFVAGQVTAENLGGTWPFCGHPGQGIVGLAVGSAVSVQPTLTGGTIQTCEFVQCDSSSVDIASGTPFAVTSSSFDDCAGVALTTNNLGMVSGCNFRNGNGAPIAYGGGGSGPIVTGTLSCGNAPNTFTGAWIDGGGNQFITICILNDCNSNGIEDSFEVQTRGVPDCNVNNVPDSCDIASASSTDCDENEIPDECQFRATSASSETLSPVQYGTTLIANFQALDRAGSDVVLTATASADLSSASETIAVWCNGNLLGTLFATGGLDCVPVSAQLIIPLESFNAIVSAKGSLTLQFIPSITVNAGTCPNSSLTPRLDYQPSVSGDCNANTIPDFCDIVFGGSPDSNGDWIPDSCQSMPCVGDFNLDNRRDGADLGILLGAWGTAGADTNADGLTNALDLGILLGAWGPCPD